MLDNRRINPPVLSQTGLPVANPLKTTAYQQSIAHLGPVDAPVTRNYGGGQSRYMRGTNAPVPYPDNIGVDFGMQHVQVPNRAVDKGDWVSSDIDGIPISVHDKNLPIIFGSRVVGGPVKVPVTTAVVVNFPNSLAPTPDSGFIYAGSQDPRIRQ